MSRVTIVIPVYNCPRYLPEAVDSVLGQSCGDWQLIIIDDGSDDGETPALCDRLAATDPRISVRHKSNGGISDARNYALPLIDTEFFSFMDADDLLHPEFVRFMLETADTTGADIVFGAVDFYRDSFRLDKTSDCPAPAIDLPELAMELALYQCGYDNTVCAKIYRYTLWENLRFTIGRRYEDLDIFYRPLLRATKVARIPVALYGYRQHQDSYIHTFAMERIDVLDVTDEMLGWVTENAPVLLPAARDRRMSAHFNILLLLYKYHVDAPEVERRCLDVIRAQRGESLRNRRVRLKNRVGALVSMIGGKPVLKLLARFFV